tara:strand:- start:1729 stop:1989 length:261 start_codon:yes stop_codon:yes gene_type:complete
VKNIKLNKLHWSLAAGLWWGLAIFALGLAGTFFSYGLAMIGVISSVYIGYAPTIIGTLIGTFWAIIDLFIGVWILIWIYEFLGKYF